MQGQAIPIGISAYGNTFGGSAVRTALRVDNMKDLIVGDASVSGAHIVLEDNSGVNNCTATEGNSNSPGIIFYSSFKYIVIDNVDASRPSGKDRSGIYINNSSINSNVTVKKL